MKKRRELDALVSSNKIHVRSTDRHVLVAQDDSSSSDVSVTVDRGGGPCQVVTRRRQGRGLCRCQTCLIAILSVLTLLCLAVCTSLVIAYLQLHQQLDVLNNRLVSDEQRYKDIPEQVRVVTEKLVDVDVRLSSAVSDQLTTLHDNVTSLQSRTEMVESTLKSVHGVITSAPELYGLPVQLRQLAKNVADVGSNLQSVLQQQQSDHVHIDIVAAHCESVNVSLDGVYDLLSQLESRQAQLQDRFAGVLLMDNVTSSAVTSEMTEASVNVMSLLSTGADNATDSVKDSQGLSRLQSSVDSVKLLLHKLTLQLNNHIQYTRHSVDELRHRVGVLEWTVDVSTDTNDVQRRDESAVDAVGRRIDASKLTAIAAH